MSSASCDAGAAADRPRVAWIFGASGVLGSAVARRLHADGWRVILSARSADVLADVESSMDGGRERVLRLPGDMTSPAWLDEAAVRVEEWVGDGRLDGLVFTTASPPEERRGTWNTGEEAFLRHWQLKCGSPLRIVDRTLPLLRQAKGAIVFTGGTDREVLPGTFIVSMANACTSYAAAYLGRELAAEGVRVNVMSPGQFQDENGPTVAASGRVKVSIPLGRRASAPEMAGVVAFLLSSDAGYITAANVVVDGGLSTAV